MKYNYNIYSNLIAFLLAVALTLSLVSCGNDSADQSNEPDVKNEITLSTEQALALVAKDREITEIFVCNSLCDKSITKAERVTLTEDNSFYSFSAIEALFAEAYLPTSEEKDFFLSYPLGKEPSVKNELGVTSVFYHSGSNYNDFINPTTITVANTEVDEVKLINGYTERGRSVSLRARYVDNAWYLEKGLYLSAPLSPAPLGSFSASSSCGSFSELKGNILVIEFYVSDDKNEITDVLELEFHKKVLEATNLLSAQAQKYGVQPNFEFKPAFFEHDGELGERVMDFDIMIAQTSFGTLRDFAEDEYNLSRYDNYVFAVCVNKNVELTTGVYSTVSDTDFYYGERVIAGNGATSTDIFLGMLELLGAYSFKDGLLDKYTESLYNAYFPNDCFLSEDVNGSTLSSVNAYACGLTDELDGLYNIFLINKD